MQNTSVFYCDGDVLRHATPANTVLTMEKCDHLRRKINVHLAILPTMKNEEPKKPKALFTISLAQRLSLILSICCFYFLNLISLSFIQNIATIFNDFSRTFPRILFDFQGPPTRKLVS